LNRLIAVDVPGGTEFLAILRRIWDAGDAVLPVDQRLPVPAKLALFAAVHPAAVIGKDLRETLLPASVPIAAGDAVVIATSGTTGDPKGVILTHAALDASAVASARRLGAHETADRWYACLPVAHIGGFSVITKAWMTATPLTLAPGFTAADVDEASATHTLVSLVATALHRVRSDAWRVILLGGSAMPADLPANIVRTYGLTETGSGLVYDGIALDGAEIRIVDGQIQVRGPMVSRGYRSSGPEGIDVRTADGWLATGDGGRLDDVGRLQVFGRLGDVITTGGEKVWPDAVERALAGLSGVRELAVAGVPDPEWGHRVVVWVVPNDPADPPTLNAVREQVKQTLPAYAAPKEVVVVEQLPRTAIGKVQRSRLLR
jgi:o-succinylbenzoate---CoA ligase